MKAPTVTPIRFEIPHYKYSRQIGNIFVVRYANLPIAFLFFLLTSGSQFDYSSKRCPLSFYSNSANMSSLDEGLPLLAPLLGGVFRSGGSRYESNSIGSTTLSGKRFNAS